jgi:hypothetical protein
MGNRIPSSCLGLDGKFPGQPVVPVRADDRHPSGTWKRSVTANGRATETTYRFALANDKLTGVVTRNAREQPIEDGAYKDGKVTFTVRDRRRDGSDLIFHYGGYLDGDTIVGPQELNGGGVPWKLTQPKIAYLGY